MYCWGANSHGQLGLGFSSEMCECPQQVESLPFDPRQIAAISAGGGHTLITLDTTGDVYCSGWNHRAQLGLGHTEDVCRFTLVGKYGFSSISCGWDVSGAISNERDVYLWGSNVWHQVGNRCEKYLSVPTKLALPNGTKAKKVCFGLRHTCILTEDGKLLLLGKTKWLQNEDIQPSVHGGVEFYEMGFTEPITNVASGENHLVIQLGQGRIVCVGDNKFGQCPKESELNRDQCQLVKQLESGWSHSGYLANDGRVYLWGRNNYRQLGVATDGDHSEPVLLDVESKVEKFCLGSQHGLALAVDGLYTWGWNEHGNCGTGGVENVTSPTRIEALVNIREIAAGAGFCWALKKM
ncbi:secretion-regulating guanine nucleotide exchange factor [Ochlerotatus camptorhynchus]|uniref:secretion-regulating guanine nucleotide exchange factor n=1 Tax=Ochlerotatus camptorhynchus TaxID=644619 RepID=UPI0031CE2CB4